MKFKLRGLSIIQKLVQIIYQTVCKENFPCQVHSFIIKLQNMQHYKLGLHMNVLQISSAQKI